MMMAIALLVRRHHVRGKSTGTHLRLLILFVAVIIGSSVGTSAYWGLSSDNGWIGYAITVPLWFIATAGLAAFVPQYRKPKVWGVPMVPWLPSLSIATNVFLMGSLDPQAFIRFGICTVVMLVYYLLFGLHATYDSAIKPGAPTNVEDGVLKIENGHNPDSCANNNTADHNHMQNLPGAIE